MSQLVYGCVVALLLVTLSAIYRRARDLFILRHVPGPNGSSWLWGHEWQIYQQPAGALWNQWIDQFGPVLKYRNSFFNGNSILVADPLAIRSILIDGPDGYAWHKPQFNRDTNLRLLGQGVIWAEGDLHRKQRRLLSPAFSSSSIKAISHAFYNTADDLKTTFTNALESASGPAVVDVSDLMSRAALDVIGSAGFQHQFNAVSSATVEAASITDGLAAALGAPPSFKMFLGLNLAKTFPWIFHHTPLGAVSAQRKSKAAIDVVSAKLLKRAQQGEGDKTSILGILVKDQKNGNGLTDQEIADNVTTMVTAGHETSGLTMAMILYELSRDLKLQQRVRDEVLVDGSVLSFDALQNGKAPVLDAVIKEVLRVYPANIRIIRDAERDMVVPVSQPLKQKGTAINHIVVPKGTNVVFPLAAINRLSTYWGPDADVFRPERWLVKDGIPENVSALPAGYDHIFTFVSGPRACLGMRFALAEMRVLISHLVAHFEFKPHSNHPDPVTVVSPAQIMIRAQDKTTGRYGVHLSITPIE